MKISSLISIWDSVAQAVTTEIPMDPFSAFLKPIPNLIITGNLRHLESWEVQILILNLSGTLFQLFANALHV